MAAEPEWGIGGGLHLVAWREFNVPHFVDGQSEGLRAGLHQQHGRAAVGERGQADGLAKVDHRQCVSAHGEVRARATAGAIKGFRATDFNRGFDIDGK